MSLRIRLCFLLLLAASFPVSAASPDCLGWMVTPSTVTMRVGEEHAFRLVGADGRPVAGASWSLNPSNLADLSSGDEPTVVARETGKFELTASMGAFSYSARIEVIPGSGNYPAGTVVWTVDPLPGGRTTKIVQSRKVSDDTPDFYVQEDGPSGHFVRAVMADGREMWRIPAAEGGCTLAMSEGKPIPRTSPLCSAVNVGMTQAQAQAALKTAGLIVSDQEAQTLEWTLERPGRQCKVYFDRKTRLVTRVRNLIVN